MKINRLIFISLLFIPAFGFASYEKLTVPKNLVPLSSNSGQNLLKSSHHDQSFWELVPHFVTEKGLTWCAVASDVMVLNAADIEPPIAAEHAPYQVFNQNNFFNAKSLTIITPAQVYSAGITLEQNAELLKSHGLEVKTVFADSVSLDTFRTQASKAVSTPGYFIIVNFCRKDLQEKGCGHFSPLGAYNAKTDQFLILDVARYKYPPVWVKTQALYTAMAEGLDSVSHKHRGYLLIH